MAEAGDADGIPVTGYLVVVATVNGIEGVARQRTPPPPPLPPPFEVSREAEASHLLDSHLVVV